MAQSKGEYRVGVSFNPSGSNVVNDIKMIAANLIDLIDTLEIPMEKADIGPVFGEQAGEVKRLKALAQTAIEEGAMWAVKAATKGTREA